MTIRIFYAIPHGISDWQNACSSNRYIKQSPLPDIPQIPDEP
ncbi:hypothetical protein [uncultured Methanospirillum sp.]|nr:hypothetical protein [uncultured Methanospirillum sp.]